MFEMPCSRCKVLRAKPEKHFICYKASDIIHVYPIFDRLIAGHECNGPVVYKTLSECLFIQGPARVGCPAENKRGGCMWPCLALFAVELQSRQHRIDHFLTTSIYRYCGWNYWGKTIEI